MNASVQALAVVQTVVVWGVKIAIRILYLQLLMGMSMTIHVFHDHHRIHHYIHNNQYPLLIMVVVVVGIVVVVEEDDV